MAGAPARRLVAAPDSFKGTASATRLADAIAEGAARAGWRATPRPMSDGGDGFADALGALGGTRHTATVSGPLGAPTTASWLVVGDTGVVEAAHANGLVLAGGAEGNDPVAATTAGVGELLIAALAAGPPPRIVIGVGGSATTDGGLGAVEVLRPGGGFGPTTIEVACDVTTPFLDAARVFGPQKGATPAQVEALTERLRETAGRYLADLGVDVRALSGAGAAGGLAGGLAALGARLRPGFDLVAELVGLPEALRDADLVVTGEGRLDATSWAGKVVGGVVATAAAAGVPVLVVAGSVGAGGRDGATPGVRIVDLTSTFGEATARTDPGGCVARAVAHALADETLTPK